MESLAQAAQRSVVKSSCSSKTTITLLDPSDSTTVAAFSQDSDLEKGETEKESQEEHVLEAAPATRESSKEGLNDEDEVTLEGQEDPRNWSAFRKWLVVAVISIGGLCVTFASSVGSSTYGGLEETFGISLEVAILTVSLYIEGLGIGPMLLGPLSEFFGRNIIYLVFFIAFFLFNLPVAFANSAPLHFVFRFLTGFSGAAFMSVAGGTISDMFPPRFVGHPLAIYTASPFLGPVVGPLVGGFINQYTNWRWTYYTLLIWAAIEVFLLRLFVPETYHPVLLKAKAQRLRKETGENKYYAPMEKSNKSILASVMASCYTPFELIIHEPMVLLLNLWTALLFGILYLLFEAFPVVFHDVHHLTPSQTGLAFIGLGVGNLLGTASQFFIWGPLQQREFEKHTGSPPPETRLFVGMAGAVAVPISLFWFAFTSYPSVHWIVPILAGVPFGMGGIWILTSVFNFLVSTYGPVAASALASNTFMRTAFAAAFPLFSTYMYQRLGTVAASALLAGLTVLMMPLPFVFYKVGPQLRKRSRFSQSA